MSMVQDMPTMCVMGNQGLVPRREYKIWLCAQRASLLYNLTTDVLAAGEHQQHSSLALIDHSIKSCCAEWSFFSQKYMECGFSIVICVCVISDTGISVLFPPPSCVKEVISYWANVLCGFATEFVSYAWKYCVVFSLVYLEDVKLSCLVSGFQ